MIFKLINKFYNLAACKTITTGCALCYQSYGDLLRFNSHFHGVFLEGGFDSEGNFVFIPIHDTAKLTQAFRQMVVKYFHEKTLSPRVLTRICLAGKTQGSVLKTLSGYMAQNKRKWSPLASI